MSAVQITKKQAEARQPKRFKNTPVGFHDEAYMVSDEDDSVVYVLLKNDSTGEVQCPCTWWCIHGRAKAQPCKHIIRYFAALADEAQMDPVVQQAGRIFDAIMHAIGVVSAGSYARNKGVGLLAAELRGFVPAKAATSTGYVDPADVFPGTSVRRIRF
jgi:hypothetical protein